MELLLSQDRVVSLLYEKTFPRAPAPRSEWQGEMLAEGSAESPESPTGQGSPNTRNDSMLGSQIQ